MLDLIIRLLFAGVSALPNTKSAELKYCFGNVEVLAISRAETRSWPFAAEAGTLACSTSNRRKTISFSPQDVYGSWVVLSNKPHRQFVTLMRHPEVFDRDLTPVEIADGFRQMVHIGEGICERSRVSRIRPCFK